MAAVVINLEIGEPPIPAHRKLANDIRGVAIGILVLHGVALCIALIVTGAIIPLTLYVVLPIAVLVLASRYAGSRFRQHFARRDQLIADADKQHQQVMAGDDAGIYGNYPPAC